MSTRNQWNTSEITSSNTVFSRMRTTIESAFGEITFIILKT